MNFSNGIRAASSRLGISGQAFVTALAVAAATFAIAYDDGSYSLPSRNTLAIAVWWAVIVGVLVRLLTTEHVTRAAIAFLGVFAGLATWTFASIFWAPSAENAFNEFNRVTLFLGVYVLVVLVARRGTLRWWCAGLELSLALITVVALISRFFPGSFPDQGLAQNLPSAQNRLSFPLGYWNGLAILVALAIPMLLQTAISNVNRVLRGLALAMVPAIACVVYLASSRGGVLAGAIGVVAFVALTEKRWSAALAILWAAIGSTVALAIVGSRHELVNGPLTGASAHDQGRLAAILVPLACLLTALGFVASSALASRLTFKPSPWLGRGTLVALVVVVLAGIVASHPIAQFNEFKRPPSVPLAIKGNDFVRSHLLSARGSGRWQFWTQAIDQWKSHPLVGEGAGSYETWWLQHTSFFLPAKDAHSLYLQSLGELGPLGFLFTVGLAIGGIAVGALRSLRSSGEERMLLAALTAGFAAYAVAAGVDWMWELTAVTVFALVMLGLLTGVAASSRGNLEAVAENSGKRARGWRFGLGVAALVGMWLLICAQGVPLFAQLRIKDSHADYKGGNYTAAIRAALDARNLQPWASSPYLQLALVYEHWGFVPAAHRAIEMAIKRDPQNWQLWAIKARLDLKLLNAKAFTTSFARAYSLNPRSTFFSGYQSPSSGP